MKVLLLSIVFFVGCAWWGGTKIYDKWENEEKKPFWTGEEKMQVCKVPYYRDEGCYKLWVTNINNTAARIHFSNGGYIVTHNLTCYFAAMGALKGQNRYVFCRSWDTDNKQWDFMPLGIDY